MRRVTLFAAACTAMFVSAAHAQVIWDNTLATDGGGQAGDNNRMYTSPSEGCNGLFVSELDTSVGGNILGYGAQATAGNRMSDMFAICEAATVSGVQLYAYQTNATVPTITGADLLIWRDGPSDIGVPVYDSTVTPPTIGAAVFDLGYRATDAAPAGCARRIQTITLSFDPPLVLEPGVYWLDWTLSGSASFSGPWQNVLVNAPVAGPPGAGTSGDAWQYTGGWGQATDGAADEFHMGVPFRVLGTGTACDPDSVLSDNDDMANPAPLISQYGQQVFFLERATADGPGASCGGGGGGPCPADISSPGGGPPDGVVDVNDFLFVFANWGTCPGGTPGCPGDISSPGGGLPDGEVDVNDFLFVFANWGPCPGGGPSVNLWYSYEAAANESLRFNTSDGSGIAVYDGAGAEIACGIGDVDVVVLDGNSYLIEIFAVTPAPFDGAVLNVNPTPSENDVCESPDVIFEGLTAFSTIGATTSGPVHAECQYDGQTYADIWFVYTATDTGFLTVSTCEDTNGGPGGSANFDTDLVVYSNTDCDNLVLLGCNDDATDFPCGGGNPDWHSVVTVPVFADQEYLIRLGGWGSDADQGEGELFVGLAPGDVSQVCQGATPLAIGDIVTGDTTGTSNDAQAITCGGVLPSAGGLWYSVVGDGNTLTATTCLVGSASYDTAISVYCGECTGLFCVGTADDDFCFIGNFNGEDTFSWCSAAGQEYLVYVHGDGLAQGNYAFQVTTNGAACSDPPPCGLEPCNLDTSGTVPEGEPCLEDGAVDVTNGGCNSTPPVFGSIALNTPIFGTTSTYDAGTLRDTDWYTFTVPASASYTYTLEAQQACDCFLLQLNPDCNTIIQPPGSVGFSTTGSAPDGTCGAGSETVTLAAGEYIVFVGINFANFPLTPCSDGFNGYVLELTSP